MTKGLCKNVFDNFKAKLYSVFGIKTLQGFSLPKECPWQKEFLRKKPLKSCAEIQNLIWC